MFKNNKNFALIIGFVSIIAMIFIQKLVWESLTEIIAENPRL